MFIHAKLYPKLENPSFKVSNEPNCCAEKEMF